MAKYDFICMGNAIVDIITMCSEDFLQEQQLSKGQMNLVDQVRFRSLYAQLQTTLQVPGGSAANTAVALANLDMNVGFVGKTAHDNLGLDFVKDLHKNRVDSLLPCLGHETPSSASIIYITEDGERTMATYLGVSHDMQIQDIPLDEVLRCEYLLVESYLLDIPACKSILASLLPQAEKEDIQIILTITDKACVQRHIDFIQTLLPSVSIVFGKEEVFKSLVGLSEHDAIENYIHTSKQLMIMTSKTGAWVLDQDQRQFSPSQEKNVIDRTAADDIFIAGFMTAYKEKKNIALCMEFARKVAQEATKVFGGRLQTLEGAWQNYRNLVS
ncbi:MAG: adenosine kinase [Pseudomonadota bacterium]|nr:adenosine kinase [Pseudomonadota bacterium]